jgi:hypothetical protein
VRGIVIDEGAQFGQNPPLAWVVEEDALRLGEPVRSRA